MKTERLSVSGDPAHSSLAVNDQLTPPLCQICGRPGKTRGLHHDHCHKCGTYRGWLCMRCNRGFFNEDAGLLMHAAVYFGRHQYVCPKVKR